MSFAWRLRKKILKRWARNAFFPGWRVSLLRSCGFTHAGLWVLDTNERALRFYNRHGWTDTGRTQVDHGPGGTELHERRLQRDLSD